MFNKIWTPLLLVVLFSFSIKSYAQNDWTQIQQIEDSMLVTADSMYHAFIPDDRAKYTERFVKQLVQALKISNSWEYEFPKLQNEINIIYPEDKSFRIFNWGIAPTEVTRRYYGAVQLPQSDLKLFPLFDYSDKIKKCEEDTVLTQGKWLGGIIYKIMSNKVDGETVYTLFTLNASSAISNKKMLDPLILTEKGVTFGAPIFDIPSSCNPEKPSNRFILEYKKEVQASMNWDTDFNAIFFDRLVSQVNDPNRKYTFVPSGQYDGLKWKGEKWVYVENLIPIDVMKDGEAPTPNPKFKQEKGK
ncbi:MAG: hypothetical protein KDC07_04325 [Chitinophagaceae bacterium]|nr:hypothetical protein [Chitinophagaceae bacterium]MCB9046238.1 hypothetical protein [Chitinophagales bacterium]